MRIRSVITTVDPDRAGDVVVPTGLQNLDEYLTEPGRAVGAQSRPRAADRRRASGSTCSRGGSSPRPGSREGVPFAEDVFALYEQGILRGWSIGFVPRKAGRVPRPGGAVGLYVTEWDLLEYSAVPIPENPGALTVALQKGLVRDATLRDWLKVVPDDRGGRWLRAFDVMSELVEADAPPVHSE